MTQVEKAEAYDKALKAIKDNLDALNEITETGAEVVNIQSIRNCFYRAFPELKENEEDEEERMIKALKEGFKYHKLFNPTFGGVPCIEIENWLKKKDEKKSSDEVLKIRQEVYQSGYNDGYKHGIEVGEQGEKKHKFNIGDIISNGKVEYRVDKIVKNCIGQDCYFLVNVECEKDGTRYLPLTGRNGETHNMGEITWLCEQVDAKFEKQCKQTISQTNERAWLYLVADVLTWKDGIGQYLDDPRVQQLAKKLCSEYEQKLYTSPKGKTNCFTD